MFALLEKDRTAIAHFKLGFDGLSVSCPPTLSLPSSYSVSSPSSSVSSSATLPPPASLAARLSDWNLQCHRTAAAYVRDLATFVAAQRDAAIAQVPLAQNDAFMYSTLHSHGRKSFVFDRNEVELVTVLSHMTDNMCCIMPICVRPPFDSQKRKLVVDSGRLTAAEAEALPLLATGATAAVRLNAFGIGAGAWSAAEFVRLLGSGDRSIGAHEVDLSTLCANLCVLDPVVVADAKTRTIEDAALALPRPPSVDAPVSAPSSCFEFGCFSSSATNDHDVSTLGRRDSVGDAANVFASTAAAPSATAARAVPPPNLSQCVVLRRVLCLLPSDASTTLPSVHPVRKGRPSKPSMSPSSSSSSLLPSAVGMDCVEDTVLPVFPAADLCSVTEDVLPGSRKEAMAIPLVPIACQSGSVDSGDAGADSSEIVLHAESLIGTLGCQMAYFAIRHFFAANGTLLDAAAMATALPSSFTEESLLATLDAHLTQSPQSRLESDGIAIGGSNAVDDSDAVAADALIKAATEQSIVASASNGDHSTTRLVHSATASGAPLRVRVIGRSPSASYGASSSAASVEVEPCREDDDDATNNDDGGDGDGAEASGDEGESGSDEIKLFLNKFHRFLDFKVYCQAQFAPTWLFETIRMFAFPDCFLIHITALRLFGDFVVDLRRFEFRKRAFPTIAHPNTCYALSAMRMCNMFRCLDLF